MSKKILLAGVAGGVVLFIWGAVAHMALGIGESSMKAMQNEEVVLAAMKENMKESGLYLFPGGVPSNDMTEAQQAELMRKWEQGPSGFLVFHPNGMPAMSAKTLLAELASNILATLVAAFLLSQALGSLTSFGSRVLFVTLIGLVPFLSISVSFWNWYGFPGGFTMGEFIEQVAGFGLAGVAMAAIMKN
jgi:hypothetical protein